MRATSTVSAIALFIALSACATSQDSAIDPLSGLYKVVARTNSVKATNFYINGTQIPLESCGRFVCTASGGFQGSLTTPVNVLLDSEHEPEAEIGGIEVVTAGSPEDWVLFGGWMTYSAFFVHRAVGRNDAELVYAQSLG